MLLTRIAALYFVSSFAVWSQEPVTESSRAPLEKIDVSATRNPELKSYRRMMDGLDAFEKNSQLAPSAKLRFILHAENETSGVAGVTLAIVGEQGSISLPIEENNTFVLPRVQAAIDENADLVSNRMKGSLRWRADVRSPGFVGESRRLGDLRLECEVEWAVSRPDLPLLVRLAALAIGGPCRSSKATGHFVAARPIAKIALIFNERKEVLPPSRIKQNGKLFTLPLYDTNWPNDTVVEFEFLNQIGTSSKSPPILE
jgi:hypothetical protein